MRIYDSFRKYADFLLEDHFEELMHFLVEEGLKSQIPLLVKLKKRPEDEFYYIVKTGLIQFLQSIKDNNFYKAVDDALEKWRQNTLIPGYSVHDIEISDITLVYRNRKIAFIHFLDYYTQDLQEWKKLVTEIETLFAYIEDKSYKTYVDIYEEKIRQEQRFFNLVVNNTEEGIFAFDNSKKITLWNKAISEQMDIPRKYAVGQPLLKVLPEYLASAEGPALDKVLAGEKIFLSNLRYQGREGFYEFQMLPIVENNEVIGGISVTRDITERKKIQDEIEQSRDYYLTLLNDFPALIWRADKNGKVNYLNRTWLKFTGKTEEEQLGDEWMKGVHPKDRSSCIDVHRNSMPANESFSIEYRLLDRENKYRWILEIGQPIYNLEGSVDGYLGACFDIQEQKDANDKLYNMFLDLQEKNEELARTEEVLRETNNDLEEKINLRTEEYRKQNLELRKINKDLDNFIYTASHDLRAPIANIEGLVNALHEDSVDIEQKRYLLDLISQSVARFKNTIHDLTEISRAQKEIYTRETVIVKDILDEVFQVLNSSINQSKANIQTNLEVETLYFSKKNFRSIMYNLISNALKFRNPARELQINIKCYRQGDWVIVSISDNGLGIEEQYQDKIFLMFKRVHSHVDGTGVGLYIVKRIMENADGKVEIESEEGIGTTFRLYFPA